MTITIHCYALIGDFAYFNGSIEPITFTLHLHTNQAGNCHWPYEDRFSLIIDHSFRQVLLKSHLIFARSNSSTTEGSKPCAHTMPIGRQTWPPSHELRDANLTSRLFWTGYPWSTPASRAEKPHWDHLGIFPRLQQRPLTSCTAPNYHHFRCTLEDNFRR